MAVPKSPPRTLVEAVQAVFDALEPFDEVARNRILQSATSLLGATGSITITPTTGSLRTAGTAPTLVGTNPTSAFTDRRISPVELVHEKKPANNSQKIAVFAFYRERVEGLSRFSKEDLRGYFSKAKQPQPQNFDRDFGKAVKLGWVYEDGDESYLTSKGIEAVEKGFEGKAMPRGLAVSNKKAGRKKGAKRGGKR